MNRHQSHDVGRLVHLPFAFAAANSLELFYKMNKVANQVTRLFKLLSQAEEFFHVGDPLRAIKVCGDHRHEFHRSDGVTQKLSNAVTISPWDQGIEQRGRALKRRVV